MKDSLSQIIWCKARVCPLKTRTLPEMELESARLLALSMAHLSNLLDIPQYNCHCWTDSQIVLAWLQKPLHKLVTFVANKEWQPPIMLFLKYPGDM